jgi:pimeloyl-ACP methyl ester carboxylesterase
MAGTGIPNVLFVHGSPGDWQAWATYLNDPALANLGTRIAVDRPGYGGSKAGGVMPDLRQQANLIAKLLPAHSQTIVVGHSLGGPLAAWLSIDHPAQVCGVVMLAGSVAPEYEAPRWYNTAAQYRVVQALIPSEMARSNLEIMPLQQELKKLDRAWGSLRRPIIALQGVTDELVDPRTADHLTQHVAPQYLTVIRIPDVGHFIPWKKQPLVDQAILRMAAQCRANAR